MPSTSRHFLFFVLFLLVGPSSGFLSWLFRGQKGDLDDLDFGDDKVPVPKAEVPFEMAVTDEKFLEKQHIMKDLAPLDTCQHLVIAEIQSTCTSMTEEEIAKLAVRLLNCQSEAEDRPTYTCTAEMTIGECTREMDGTTWNAYQIVSNRARAICYSTRQQQFRLKTEHTVNRLVHTTKDQILAMKMLKDGQDKVNEVTGNTLKKMEEGQDDLLRRQAALKSTQRDIHSFIASNLRDLTREKALIAAGNKELADMTENIRKKLDNATKKLESHELTQKGNHKDILDDLASIREKARQVWDKIDEATKNVMNYHKDTAQHYSATLENLERVNTTISHVLSTITELESSVTDKLGWISTYLDGTGERFALLSTVVLHVLYFLEAAVTMSILRTPHFSRVILLLVVPLNAWSEVRHQTSLNFTAMTLFLILTITVNWLGDWLYQRYYIRPKDAATAGPGVASGNTSPEMMLVPFSPLSSGGPNGYAGVNSPDLRKLVVILETLCKQGILSPAVRATSSDDSVTSSNQGMESDGGDGGYNPPVDGETAEGAGEGTATPHDDALHNTSLFNTSRDITDSAKARVDMVRRRLLNSPLGVSGLTRTPRPPSDLASEEQPSPPRSRRSTPLRTIDRSSRASTPRRGTCKGVTVAGTSCKNASVEQSEYCYRHKYQETDSDTE